MARLELPELFMMDLGLPVLDGWEAIRRIKAAPETRHIPVVALTTHARNQDRDRAREAGCDDFDTKPVDIVQLDIMMPVMNGYEALRRMKSEMRLRAIPVIMISAATGWRASCAASRRAPRIICRNPSMPRS